MASLYQFPTAVAYIYLSDPFRICLWLYFEVRFELEFYRTTDFFLRLSHGF